MNHWLRRISREQLKLALSVGTNFLTRVPGAVGLLWFLPLLHVGLGTDEYAALLSAMALASAAAFQSGGLNLLGRRLVGEAYAAGDRDAEADAFISTVLASAIASGGAVALITLYVLVRGESWGFLAVASLTAIGLFGMMFDSVRSAYNEHYITASILVVLQSAAYATGLSFPVSRDTVLFGAFILTGPYWVTSLITLVLLIRDKPHLFQGRPTVLRRVLRQGTMLAIADGSLMASLSLSVVWMQASVGNTTSAWYATNVRLFQTLLVPVYLLLVPLSSYARICWNQKSSAQQWSYTKATLLIGLAYGGAVASALYFASAFYIGSMLDLPVISNLSIFLLFGAIVAYKSYSSIAYVVLDENAHLSWWTTAAVFLAIVLGLVVNAAFGPLNALSTYATSAGTAIILILLWNVVRSARSQSNPVRAHLDQTPG